MKIKQISYILIVVLLIVMTPYFITFNGGLSPKSETWANFGNYVSGISSLLNVIVFIYLTIIIHSIDVNLKKTEIKKEIKKEQINRFIIYYEEIILKLTDFQVLLVDNHLSKKEISKDELISYYKCFVRLKNMSETYLNKTLICQEIGEISQNTLTLIDLHKDNHEAFNNEIKKVAQSISSLMPVIIKEFQKQLNNE